MIPMPELRTLYESLGLNAVATYIQSGNVVFDTPEDDPVSIRLRLERAIQRSFGFPVSVILRQVPDLKRVIRTAPFGTDGSAKPEHLYVTFLEAAPAKMLVKGLGPLTVPTNDEYKLAGKEIFLHCPNGYGKTLLSNTFFEKHLKLRATTRNWKTVHALVALAGARQG